MVSSNLEAGAEPGWIRLPQRGRGAEPHAGTGMCGLLAGPLDMMLSPYIGVEKPGDVERHTGGREAKLGLTGMGTRGTSGLGKNGAAAELAAILLNNRTTGDTGI